MAQFTIGIADSDVDRVLTALAVNDESVSVLTTLVFDVAN